MPEVKIYQDATHLTQAAVEQFVQLAQDSINERGEFTVALSGGSTPKPIYLELGKPKYQTLLDWKHIHLFWGDERHVLATHPDSNFRMVQEQLLMNVPIPEENIHRVPAELEIQAAAVKYEAELKSYFSGELPRFDLIFLGMGEDGHTASLFPCSAGLDEEVRWFIANFAPKEETWRLTLTKQAINAARNILVVVQGASKAGMLADVLTGPDDPEVKPIQLIEPKDGKMIWLIDEASASDLPAWFLEQIS